MTIDENIATARTLLAESETRNQTARGLLVEIQEGLDAMRRELALQQPRTFSEREMAAWLGCNERQLRAYRLKNRETVKPIMVTRTPRYSTWHQVNAQEIFTGLVVKPQRKKSQVSASKSNLISDSRLQIQERRRA